MLLSQAEMLIQEAKVFVLPEVSLMFYSNKSPVLLAPMQKIVPEQVKREQDVLVLECGGKRLLLAVNPNEELIERLANGEESALAFTYEAEGETFVEELLAGTMCKTWLYNAYAQKIFRRYLQTADRLPIVNRKGRRQVPGCPRQVRVYRSQPYANLDMDCNACECCIDNSEPDVVLCSARQRFVLPEDFGKPLSARSVPHADMEGPTKTELVRAGLCPKCGNKLQERKLKKGNFMCCTAYPFCHFMAEKMENGEVLFTLLPNPQDL